MVASHHRVVPTSLAAAQTRGRRLLQAQPNGLSAVSAQVRVHDRLLVSVADAHIVRLDLDVKHISLVLDRCFVITVERLAGDRRLAFWLYDGSVPSIEAPIPLLESD